MLKKSRSFSFYKDGLVVDGEALPTDIVIFATGYKSGQKIKNIFASTYFEKCMCECLVPLYRYYVSLFYVLVKLGTVLAVRRVRVCVCLGRLKLYSMVCVLVCMVCA